MLPTAKQGAAIGSFFYKDYKIRNHINIMTGAVRSGKTVCLLFAMPLIIKVHWNENILISAKTLNNVESNLLEPLRNIYGKEYIGYIVNKCTVTIFGKRCDVIPFNNELAVGKLQGRSFGCAICDEIVLAPQSFFNMLISRLDKEDFQLFATCNPSSPNHYIKQYIDNARVSKNVIHWTIQDNPTLPKDVVDNLINSYKDSPVFYKRFILGEWCNAEGLAAFNFDRKVHTISADEIDYNKAICKSVSLVIGIDPATMNDKTGVVPVLFMRESESEYSHIVLDRMVHNPKTSKQLSNIQQIELLSLHIRRLFSDEYMEGLLKKCYSLEKIMVVDCAASDMVLQLRNKFEPLGWTIISFTKKDTRKTMDIMNNIFIKNLATIVKSGSAGDWDYTNREYSGHDYLVEELESVKTMEDKTGRGRYMLDPRDPNDVFDGYRYAIAYFYNVDDLTEE